MVLRNRLLVPVRAQVHHPTSGISDPQGSIGLGQYALWPLQPVSGVPQSRLIDSEIEDRIGGMHGFVSLSFVAQYTIYIANIV